MIISLSLQNKYQNSDKNSQKTRLNNLAKVKVANKVTFL